MSVPHPSPVVPHPSPVAAAVAVMFVPSSPERWLVAVRSLLAATDLPIEVGVLYPHDGRTFTALDDRVTWRPVGSVSELVNTAYARTGLSIVVVDDAVVLPPGAFSTAMRWIRDDLRVGSVSFLSNAADFLSFPTRNLPVDRTIDGHDEVSITRRLRSLAPSVRPAPIVHAAGSVVVLSAAALGAVGELQAPHSARFDIAVADFCARARAKGFVDLLDASTYYARPSDVATKPIGDTMTADDLGWLLHRHRSLIAFLEHERLHGDSPMAMAHQVARVKVQGLRVLVDGSCFGPNEVGTQVATVQTVKALAARGDVAWIGVALTGPVPAYAASVLTHPKVQATAGDVATAFGPPGTIDIAFRPYQPVPGFDLARWKGVGVRFVVSMLDTIAFHNGGYFATSDDWLAYRAMITDAMRAADAVTVISADVAMQMELHQLPVESTRVHVAALGTDHLRGDEAVAMPAELTARGFVAGEFALCQGVNYTHKNRELAMAAQRILLDRGFDLSLVMAGASVPHGTTRAAEAQHAIAGFPRDRLFVLPELSSAERSWLLRHARFVWAPTSAEGFGMVPFEAARFGTPTVAVDFGPMAELAGSVSARAAGSDVPVLAPRWDPVALADTAERLLRDPDLAHRHVDALLARGARYTWADTAATLVSVFRGVLGRPRR